MSWQNIRVLTGTKVSIRRSKSSSKSSSSKKLYSFSFSSVGEFFGGWSVALAEELEHEGTWKSLPHSRFLAISICAQETSTGRPLAVVKTIEVTVDVVIVNLQKEFFKKSYKFDRGLIRLKMFWLDNLSKFRFAASHRWRDWKKASEKTACKNADFESTESEKNALTLLRFVVL